MEVSVLSSDGVPSGSLLSLRSGNWGWQGPACAQLTAPVSLPVVPEASCEVGLLAPLGAKQISLTPGTMTVPVDFAGAAGATLTLRISNRHMSPSLQAPTSNVSTDVEAMAGLSTSCIKDGTQQSYLDQHNLLDSIQTLLKSVLEERPDDPHVFMAKRLLTARGFGKKAESGAAAAPTETAQAAKMPPQEAAPGAPTAQPDAEPQECPAPSTEPKTEMKTPPAELDKPSHQHGKERSGSPPEAPMKVEDLADQIGQMASAREVAMKALMRARMSGDLGQALKKVEKARRSSEDCSDKQDLKSTRRQRR